MLRGQGAKEAPQHGNRTLSHTTPPDPTDHTPAGTAADHRAAAGAAERPDDLFRAEPVTRRAGTGVIGCIRATRCYMADQEKPMKEAETRQPGGDPSDAPPSTGKTPPQETDPGSKQSSR